MRPGSGVPPDPGRARGVEYKAGVPASVAIDAGRWADRAMGYLVSGESPVDLGKKGIYSSRTLGTMPDWPGLSAIAPQGMAR